MDMSKAREVGAEIRRRLKQKNIKQNAAAAALNMEPPRFNNYCQGVRETDYAGLCAIASYLGCTPNDLLGFPTSIDRDLFNEVVTAVDHFLADYQQDITPERRGPVYWAIYDTAVAEPETMLDDNGQIKKTFLSGLMRAALSL